MSFTCMIILLIEIQIQTMRRSRLSQRSGALPRGKLVKARTAPATTSFHFARTEEPPSSQGAATSRALNRTSMKRPARHLRCRDHCGGDERAGKVIADSDPALRPEHGWREHQHNPCGYPLPDAETRRRLLCMSVLKRRGEQANR